MEIITLRPISHKEQILIFLRLLTESRPENCKCQTDTCRNNVIPINSNRFVQLYLKIANVTHEGKCCQNKFAKSNGNKLRYKSYLEVSTSPIPPPSVCNIQSKSAEQSSWSSVLSYDYLSMFHQP